jgi:hypothetical protein
VTMRCQVLRWGRRIVATAAGGDALPGFEEETASGVRTLRPHPGQLRDVQGSRSETRSIS